MSRFDFVWFDGKKYKVKPYEPSKKEKRVILNGTYRSLAEYQHEKKVPERARLTVNNTFLYANMILEKNKTMFIS